MRARVASAGTGKTTSLVARYLELIDGGVPLRRIAGVTFTRSAANELRQRVAQGVREARATGTYLGGLFTPTPRGVEALARAERELGGAVLTTIHGFMGRCLRLNAPRLGLDTAFTTLSATEAAALFEEELRSLALLAQDPAHSLHAPFARHQATVTRLARTLFDRRSLAVEFIFGETEVDEAVAAVFEAAYSGYQARLGAQALGPGELERRALRMLEVPAARDRLARRFPVVLVDEYQDVNPLQGRFFELLADSGSRLELVGDPKQSIYLFRAADVEVFRRALATAGASGELLDPLVETRRHSRSVVRFLNRLTQRLAAGGRGFGPAEAPDVRPAGDQARVDGSVEVIVVADDGYLADLRPTEAVLLAQRLRQFHHEHGLPYEKMAVVARRHSRLVEAQDALTRQGVPSLMLKGRGYYWRSEVRDVYHALSVGIDPAGPSLAAFLRGPFAGLAPDAIREVVRSPAPLQRLAELAPEVAQRLAALRRTARLPPVDAIRQVTSAPLIGDRRLVEFLGRRERTNLDALLLDVARRPPADIEALLQNLDELAQADEQAVVPEGGAGVRLMTVHASKGLEFDLVAVFDAGGGKLDRPQPVLVDPRSGRVTLHAAGDDASAQSSHREREEQEAYRLLYVAASRARDHLLVSLSVAGGRRLGWAEALLGLDLEDGPLEGVRVTRHGRTPPTTADAVPEPVAVEEAVIEPAPWIDQRIASNAFAPLMSPSRLVDLLGRRADAATAAEGTSSAVSASDPTAAEELEEQQEPMTGAELALADDDTLSSDPGADAGADTVGGAVSGAGVAFGAGVASGTGVAFGDVPGRGRALGTLVHYAISRDWLNLDQGRRELLGAQEAVWPFADSQREGLLDEVAELLEGYAAMLGSELPALDQRESDRAEVPLATASAGTVWEGVLDRLYRVGGSWVIEDYKTDRRVAPERYFVQLGLYLHAAGQVLGERPLGRLVYLRSRTVVEPPVDLLEAALAEAGVVTEAAVAGRSAQRPAR